MGETTSQPKTKMQSFYIFNQKFSTIDTLKAFALEHGINPVGNKTLKATWINAITGHYLTAQSIVAAIVVEADPIAATIAVTVEETVITIGKSVVKALTSETAVLVYRVALKAVAFALVMVWLLTASAVKWCWQRRSSTAVYHWIKAAIESEATQYALSYLIFGQWVINEWIDTTRSDVRSTVTACRVWADVVVEDARSVVG